VRADDTDRVSGVNSVVPSAELIRAQGLRRRLSPGNAVLVASGARIQRTHAHSTQARLSSSAIACRAEAAAHEPLVFARGRRFPKMDRACSVFGRTFAHVLARLVDLQSASGRHCGEKEPLSDGESR
jgi:hypothetical protein